MAYKFDPISFPSNSQASRLRVSILFGILLSGAVAIGVWYSMEDEAGATSGQITELEQPSSVR